MPSPIAKYFSRALKKCEITENPGFFAGRPHLRSQRHGRAHMEVFCGNPGQPAIFFAEGGRKNRDIENRLHKPFNNDYRQLRKQKMLRLAQSQSILIGI